MATSIDVIFNGVDKLSGVINKIANANATSTKEIFNAVGGWSALGDAAKKTAQYINDAANETAEYAEDIRNMSRITGDSAEETSRLVQVTDDLMISQGELEMAMRGAVIKGIDTSIEGLAKLSDEYLKLDKGLERSEFLTDKFGRTGLAMGALMEKGGDGIRAMTDAVDESLVMTDEAVQQSKEYKEAVDNLNDAYQGFKYTVGRAVIPALTDLTLVMKDVIAGTDDLEGRTLFEKFKSAAKDAEPAIKTVGDAMNWIAEETDKAVAAMQEDLGYTQEQFEGWKEAAVEAAKEHEKAMEAMKKTSIEATRKIMEVDEEYRDSLEELMEEQGNLRAEKQKLIDQTPWETEAIQTIITKYDENETKIREVITARQENRAEILLDVAMSQLDIDKQYELLHALGYIDDATYNNVVSTHERAKAFQEETVDVWELVESIDADRAALQRLDGSTAVTRIITQKLVEEFSDRAAADAAVHGYAPPAQDWDKFAAGGSFTVPPGYPNDSYGMMVSSGEHVTVTPAGEKTYSGNGGGIVINLQYSPVVSLADRYEAETKLVPYIESALRKIR